MVSVWSARTKAAVVIAAQVASAAVAYGSLLIAGRFFEPESYGMFSFALGATTLLAIVTDLGVGTAHQRAIARGDDRRQALTALTILRAVLLAVVALVSLLVAVLAFPWLDAHLRDTVTWKVLGAGIVFQLVLMARSLIEATWYGEQRPHLVEALRLIDACLTLPVLACAALVIAALQGNTPPFVALGHALANLLGLENPFTLEGAALLLLGSYLVARIVSLGIAVRWAIQDGIGFGPWNSGLGREFLWVAIPLSLAYAMAVVVTTTDVVMLGLFGGARDVAYYTAAQRIATLGILATGAVTTILFPRFTQLHAIGDIDGLEATSVHAHRYLLLVAAPLAAAMMALPSQGLAAVLGSKYIPAASALRWLAVWALTMALLTPLTARLLGEGRDRVAIQVSVLIAVLNVALNFLLIPTWGLGWFATGAAAGTTLATLAALVFTVLRSKYRGFLEFGLNQAPAILGAAALTGLGWWAAGHWAPSYWLDHTHELLAVGVAGLALYASALRLLGGLPDEDLAVLRRLIHPRSWLPRKDA